MKKSFLFILLSFCIYFTSFSQENTLIFVHPTEYNLDLFNHLIHQGIIEIDSLKIIGVYHSKENYDYSKSETFIKEKELSFIKLIEIKEELLQDQLYTKNNCSNIFTDLFEKSNGIFFFGGPDLPPAIYGEQTGLVTRMTDPYRHYMEASFLFHLLGGSQNSGFVPLLEANPDYTIYGICLGMQTMNVATGGTMVQDIPSEIYELTTIEKVLKSDNNTQHRNYNNNLVNDSSLFSGNFHEIKISDLEQIVGKYNKNNKPLVYSNHHQAIESLGKDLKIIATSTDGKIIEAIAHKKYPNVLGIQFHPEGTYLHNQEIICRINPTDELKSGKQILIDSDSYDFHLEFWKEFSRKMNLH
ncbi:MAG: gamma-glutamyl-gamma-aminobutyrate hydrolase family protein [Bacteroidales bacterium]|nr:gamma-glutamyl-gamma-aminobutyrate hydrolase family protein [Bacteroidales bacterium]